MGRTRKGANDISAGKITSEAAPAISCYNRRNYDFSGIKANALAWFIQFAIRADLLECQKLVDHASDQAEFSGQYELLAKASEIRDLIRTKHIIDEPALQSIGLSFYHFPTLSHFFVAREKQAFVREATVREVLEEVVHIRNLLAESPLSEFHSEDDDPFSPVLHMTPTQVEKTAEIPENRISRERFVVVDMAAPVTVLKDQFLKTLSRAKKQKLSAYDHWLDYGVLPYIDLRDWEKTTDRKILMAVRTNLLYGEHSHGSKTIEETTEPHADRLLNMGSAVSCDLKAEASEQFTQAIAFVHDETLLKEEEGSQALEALDRWFPRSYPWNLPDLMRTARLMPESALGISTMLLLMEASGDLELTAKERIKKLGPDYDNAFGFLNAVKAIHES